MLFVTILAGGMGKRMNSTLPKVLHEINGLPMIVHIIKNSYHLKPTKIIIVVGNFYEVIKQTIDNICSVDITNIIEYSLQKKPLGTGSAVMSTIHILNRYQEGINLILNGDTPLLKYQTLNYLVDKYRKNINTLQITGIYIDNPFGYGRIIQHNDDNNNINNIKIIEEKDCTNDEKMINLVNCGIYVIDINVIKQSIPRITNNNIQNEYYLTDILKYNTYNSCIILSSKLVKEIFNINTSDDLQHAKSFL